MPDQVCRTRRSASAHLAAPAATTVEDVAAVALEPDTALPAGISTVSRSSPVGCIDTEQITRVAFPSAVPKIAFDEGDAGDEARRFDGAKNMNLPLAVHRYPQLSSAQVGPASAPPDAGAGSVDTIAPVPGSISRMRSPVAYRLHAIAGAQGGEDALPKSSGATTKRAPKQGPERGLLFYRRRTRRGAGQHDRRRIQAPVRSPPRLPPHR